MSAHDLMVGVVSDHLERIKASCAQRGGSFFDLVGSASRADFDPNCSDIDVLVDSPDGVPELFDAYIWLREDLTRILGRNVDVIMGRGVRNPLLLPSWRDDVVRLYSA